MWRTLIFLVALAVVGNFFALLADSNGKVVILLMDTWRIDTEMYILWGILFLTLILCILIAALSANWRVLRYRWQHRHELRQLRKFQTTALSQEQNLIQFLANYISDDQTALRHYLQKLKGQRQINSQLLTLLTVLASKDPQQPLVAEVMTMLNPNSKATRIYRLESQLKTATDADTQLALAEEIYALEPRSLRYRQQLLQLYKLQAKWEQAYHLSRESDTEVLLQLLLSYYQAGQYKACIKLAKQMLTYTQLSAAVYIIARIYLVKSSIKTHQYTHALHSLLKDVEHNFDMTLLRFTSQLLSKTFGKHQWRYRWLNYRLAKLAKPSLLVILLRIQIYIRLNQLTAAKHLLDTAWEQYPGQELAMCRAELELQEFGSSTFSDSLRQKAQEYPRYTPWYCNKCNRHYAYLPKHCPYMQLSYQETF